MQASVYHAVVTDTRTEMDLKTLKLNPKTTMMHHSIFHKQSSGSTVPYNAQIEE